MNKTCEQCRLPYDGTKVSRFCSPYCRIFAKNRKETETWVNSKKKEPQLSHPWSGGMRLLSGSDR